MATVYARGGRRLVREGEVEETIAAGRQIMARQAAEIEDLRRRLEER